MTRPRADIFFVVEVKSVCFFVIQLERFTHTRPIDPETCCPAAVYSVSVRSEMTNQNLKGGFTGGKFLMDNNVTE